jgi:hypothetical protein
VGDVKMNMSDRFMFSIFSNYRLLSAEDVRKMSDCFMFSDFLFQPLQAIVCGRCEDEDERSFYVLSGTQFQKWNLSQPFTEKV